MELEFDATSVTTQPKGRGLLTIIAITTLEDVLGALKESAERADIAEFFGFDDPEAEDD